MKKLVLFALFVGAYTFGNAQCTIQSPSFPQKVCEYTAGITLNSNAPIGTSPSTVKWYDSTYTQIHTGIEYIAQPAVLSPGNHTFYVKEDGCSNYVPFKLEVIDIPVIAPRPFAFIVGEIGTISVPEAKPSDLVTWYWENSPISAPISTGQTFSVNTNTVGTYTYYVSITRNGCESPKVPYTVNVSCAGIPLSAIQTTYNINMNAPVPTLQVTPSNVNVGWYQDKTTTILLGTGTSFTPTINTNVASIHTFYARSNNNCGENVIPFTINIHSCDINMPKTSVEELSTLLGEEIPRVYCTSTLAENEEIVWCWGLSENFKIGDVITAADTIGRNLKGEWLELYRGNPGKYHILVSIHNTLTGCWSAPKFIPVTVHECIATPTFISQKQDTVFVNEPIPNFEVAEENTEWLDMHENVIAKGKSFSTPRLKPGTHNFYAQQTNGDCKSFLEPIHITVKSYSISGKVFYDKNKDGIFQDIEIPIANDLLLIKETNEIISTNANGEYIWHTNVQGTYTITLYRVENTTEIEGEISKTLTIGENSFEHSHINFCYKSNQNKDISVKVYPWNQPLVGRKMTYKIDVTNKGQKQYNITTRIKFENAKCDFEKSSIEEISHAGNEVEIMIDSVEENSCKSILVEFKILPNWTLGGQQIKIIIHVSANLSEQNLQNNSDSLSLEILNSFDPNDKAVTPSEQENGYVLMDSTLEYKIRFQNKGTAEAWDIYVVDTLDTNLDISTFKVLSTSHNMHFRIKDRVVTFYFDNIMLPAEKMDEDGSNGYIIYEIKPLADLPENTKVNNTAHIFFDFNPAVVTNTTLSTYVTEIPKSTVETSVSEISEDVYLAPNPAKSQTKLVIEKEGFKQIQILDAQGKVVISTMGYQNVFAIDCSTLSAGTYTCVIVNNSQTITKQLIIN